MTDGIDLNPIIAALLFHGVQAAFLVEVAKRSLGNLWKMPSLVANILNVLVAAGLALGTGDVSFGEHSWYAILGAVIITFLSGKLTHDLVLNKSTSTDPGKE